MTIDRNQKATRKQATGVLIVAIVIAVREAYISGSCRYYVIALSMLLISVLNFRPKAKKTRTQVNKDTPGMSKSFNYAKGTK